AEVLGDIQAEVEKIVSEANEVTTEMVTKDEILKRNIQVPFDLPSNKPLRLLQIGNYPAMPDGGTHLKNTKESWPVRVTEIKNDGEKTVVMYAVESPEEKKE